ncbi:MAG: sodium/solute symporter [Candidatus Hydrogenedentota bacterium]
MFSKTLVLLPVLAMVASVCLADAEVGSAVTMKWSELPELPEPMGGQFAGVHETSSGDVALIVAGGTKWEGSFLADGTKHWLDTIYVYTLPEGKGKKPGVIGALRELFRFTAKKPLNTLVKTGSWREAGRLPAPLSYGASVSTGKGVVCVGGMHENTYYDTTLLLQWDGDTITQSKLPPLPEPMALGCAAAIGNVVYAGAGKRGADTDSNEFWRLDLDNPVAGWETLAPLPGPARILPVASAQDGSLYIFSGAALREDKSGRDYLTDAYCFTPKQGWTSLEPSPRPVAAAPAVPWGDTHILIFSGDDGKLVDQIAELGDDHPGYPLGVLGYHTVTSTWTTFGEIPESLLTTPGVVFQEGAVVAGGEPQPGHRSKRVLWGIPKRTRKAFGWIDYSAIGVYFLILVTMGVYFSRREKSTNDFFLGGRRVPWWAAGISIYGTLLSAISFLATPATSYKGNWIYAVGNILMLAIAPIVIYFYLPFFRRLNVTTAYEYLEKRFNLAVRMFGSTAFTVFQLGRMGIVLLLPALALSAVTGIDLRLSILVMGVLCTFYTVLGGIEAVIWTDVLQVFVLLGGAWLSLFLISSSVDGGFFGMIQTGYADGKFHLVTWGWDITQKVFFVVIIGRFLEALIPYTTDQTVVQRYLTTSSEKQAARSIWTGAIFSLPSFMVFFGIGTALYVFYKEYPGQLDPNLTTDQIFPLFIVQTLPTGIGGLVVAAVFAAAMSSLDSSMNSVSAVLVTDFYRRFWGGGDEKRAMYLARTLTIFLGVFATLIALYMAVSEITGLWEKYMSIIGLFGGSLAGVFALGIFTRRTHGVGALIGAVVGAVVLYYVQRYTPLSFLLYSTTGILVSFSVGYLMSIIIPAPPKDVRGLTWATLGKRPDED